MSPSDAPSEYGSLLSVKKCLERRRVLDAVLLCSTIATKDWYCSVPEVEQKLGVLDCVDYGIFFLYPQKVKMALLAPEVDSVPSDVCCDQCCGETMTIVRSGM